MNRIYSNYNMCDGSELYYEILVDDNGNENGFDIFMGESTKYPMMHQPEPFIPKPELSYAENAIEMCKQLSDHSGMSHAEKSVEERLTNVEANIDYLMLLNDADSATEGETE